jgi:hypothetical protein
MNHYINQLIMYHEIQQQKRKGKQPSQIASFLGMDTRTTKKYLAMTERKRSVKYILFVPKILI